MQHEQRDCIWGVLLLLWRTPYQESLSRFCPSFFFLSHPRLLSETYNSNKRMASLWNHNPRLLSFFLSWLLPNLTGGQQHPLPFFPQQRSLTNIFAARLPIILLLFTEICC